MTLAMKDGLRDPRDETVLCQQWPHKSKHVIKLNRTKHTHTHKQVHVKLVRFE